MRLVKREAVPRWGAGTEVWRQQRTADKGWSLALGTPINTVTGSSGRVNSQSRRVVEIM